MPYIRILTVAKAETIRVLVWILSFMSFGYATGEFEVTADRLGVYRPEEHIGKIFLRFILTCANSLRRQSCETLNTMKSTDYTHT